MLSTEPQQVQSPHRAVRTPTEPAPSWRLTAALAAALALGACHDAPLAPERAVLLPPSLDLEATSSLPVTWYIRRDDGGFDAVQLGLGDDVPVPGDYDGDGAADAAVYRPTTGRWYVVLSTSLQMLDLSFGQAGDVPVPGDYDGDGRADLAVFRPSTAQWVILPSATGVATFGQFGLATDVPVPGDYDGDGRTDVAVFRPSSAQWWIRPSQSGVAYPVTFGLATDSLVPADYDGDGRTDLAVFRPASGAWWIQRSSTNTIEQRNWGSATDVPVPADYDGDGAADAAIFRPGTAEWWVKESSTQNQVQVRFGLGTDTPLPGRYAGGDRDRIAVLRAALIPQSISFTSTAPAEAPLGGTYDVAATGGGSGNPVTFSSSTPLVCTVDGSTVAFVALGSCVVAANQAGGGGFEAATEVTQVMSVVLPFTFAPPTLPPPALNAASAGSVVRISFDLGGNRGLAVLAPQSPASAPVSCTPPHAATGPSVAAKGAGGGLTYATSSGLYTYAWKTEKAWWGTCREIVLQLIDGTSRSAIYQFR